mmetsp:Transcript_66915/g.173181  ORF Transcript_66915/g.173181 Transcript_66915/m.173181 type:complete len:81 (+) Transcript_66915:1346-1588(+)
MPSQHLPRLHSGRVLLRHAVALQMWQNQLASDGSRGFAFGFLLRSPPHPPHPAVAKGRLHQTSRRQVPKRFSGDSQVASA